MHAQPIGGSGGRSGSTTKTSSTVALHRTELGTPPRGLSVSLAQRDHGSLRSWYGTDDCAWSVAWVGSTSRNSLPDGSKPRNGVGARWPCAGHHRVTCIGNTCADARAIPPRGELSGAASRATRVGACQTLPAKARRSADRIASIF
jgi:hypothetical protein